MLCDQEVQTDRTISSIIMRVNEKGRYLITDIAISGDRNVIKKKPQSFKYIKN
jgi:hypothetical protein